MDNLVELAARNELIGEGVEQADEVALQSERAGWSFDGYGTQDNWASIEVVHQTVTGLVVSLPLLMTPDIAITRTRFVFGEANWKEITPKKETDREKFDSLAEQWERATLHLSSFGKMKKKPEYLRMLQFGERAVPWILERMRTSDAFWFLLLREIVPSPPDILPGNVHEITEAWQAWGNEYYGR